MMARARAKKAAGETQIEASASLSEATLPQAMRKDGVMIADDGLPAFGPERARALAALKKGDAPKLETDPKLPPDPPTDPVVQGDASGTGAPGLNDDQQSGAGDQNAIEGVDNG